MAIVLDGNDPKLDRGVAVKVLLDRYCEQWQMVRRFLAEAIRGK
jgi:hypothetical protein